MSKKALTFFVLFAIIVTSLAGYWAYRNHQRYKASVEELTQQQEAYKQELELVYSQWQKDKADYQRKVKQIERKIAEQVVSMSLSDLADAFNRDLHGSGSPLAEGSPVHPSD
jgi:Tfp pilus assembly protein PilV